MTQAQPADTERLPWLEPYRENRPPSPLARRPSTRRISPFTFLLPALLIVALVGLASFWVGRRTASPAVNLGEPAQGPSVTIPVAQVEPIPMPDAIPNETIAAERTRVPVESRRPIARKPATRRPAVRPSSSVHSRRPPPPPKAPPKPRAANHWAPPVIAGRPGQVIDLGRFLSPRLADAAYRATVRRYPYLGRLTKVVTPTIQPTGKPRLYRLQLGARSSDEARQLCRNLMRINRPCTVV